MLALVQSQTAIASCSVSKTSMRQYRVYDLNGIVASYFYNGGKIKLVWRIVDNRNGNAVVSIFEIGHD